MNALIFQQLWLKNYLIFLETAIKCWMSKYIHSNHKMLLVRELKHWVGGFYHLTQKLSILAPSTHVRPVPALFFAKWNFPCICTLNSLTSVHHFIFVHYNALKSKYIQFTLDEKHNLSEQWKLIQWARVERILHTVPFNSVWTSS